MSSRKVTRRRFLVSSTLTATSLALAACAQPAPTPQPTQAPVKTEPTKPAATAAPAQPTAKPAATTAPTQAPAPAAKFKEAPQLAALVAAGKLPPVQDRLPLNPEVVKPFEKIGKYGGQWTSGSIETNGNDYKRIIGYEQLVRWTPKWDGVIPSVAESYQSNAEGTQFTFKLRKGLKWSDGKPYTADDIVFWYEDVVMNKDVSPTPPTTPYKVEKIDDYTVVWKFETPQGLFIKQIAQVDHNATAYPKHYLQQFHKKYNPNADELAKKENLATWVDLFTAKDDPHQNPDLPRLWAWLPTQPIGKGGTRVVCERNPYYFKVDPEGNQLPYIDRFNMEFVTNNEVLVLKCLNGEIDFQEQWISAAKNKPVFVDNQEKGKYHLFETTPTYVGEFVIQFNRDCTDPVKAEIFRNKDFRIGLSYAINRQELIDVVMVGQSAPQQAAPRPDSPYYDERLAKQYTEYDLKKANEYLDKCFPKKDAQGFRLGPDGKRISFIMEIDQGRTTYVDMCELIKPMWAKVGIEMNVKLIERSLWEERCRRKNFDFHVSGHKFGGGAGESVLLDPRFWFPNSGNNCMYAKKWGFWYQNPKDPVAEEPPAEVKKSMELWRQLIATPDEQKQKELLKQIFAIAADQFYCIGTVLEMNGYGICTNRLKNTPKTLPLSWIYPTPAPFNTCQFYIEG